MVNMIKQWYADNALKRAAKRGDKDTVVRLIDKRDVSVKGIMQATRIAGELGYEELAAMMSFGCHMRVETAKVDSGFYDE